MDNTYNALENNDVLFHPHDVSFASVNFSDT